jgi:aminomethyltransferase
MDDRHLPLEFGLNEAISLDKGCYRGQEIMARITYRGHLNRRLGAIAIHHSHIPSRGTEVRAQGAKVGEVSSAVFSPRLQSPLALAVLKADSLRPGTSVELASQDGRMIRGEVVPLPLQ